MKTSTSTERLNRDLQKSLADLRKLGSAIRQDLRAAGEDARHQWKKFLEPQMHGAERLVKEVSEASHAAVARTAAAFGEFKRSLKKAPRPVRKAPAPKRIAH